MGGIGLPGDLSSMSRFVKATFTKLNSVSGDSESESISQFFHILGSVEQQKGLCDVGGEKYSTPFIPHVAIWIKEFIIIEHTETVKLLVWICTKRI